MVKVELFLLQIIRVSNKMCQTSTQNTFNFKQTFNGNVEEWKHRCSILDKAGIFMCRSPASPYPALSVLWNCSVSPARWGTKTEKVDRVLKNQNRTEEVVWNGTDS